MVIEFNNLNYWNTPESDKTVHALDFLPLVAWIGTFFMTWPIDDPFRTWPSRCSSIWNRKRSGLSWIFKLVTFESKSYAINRNSKTLRRKNHGQFKNSKNSHFRFTSEFFVEIFGSSWTVIYRGSEWKTKFRHSRKFLTRSQVVSFYTMSVYYVEDTFWNPNSKILSVFEVLFCVLVHDFIQNYITE